MALQSKTITGSTNNSNWSHKLVVIENSTNINNNTSSLTVEAYIGRNTNASYMYGANINCNISVTGCGNQSLRYSNSGRVDIAGGGWLKIGQITFNVPHNSDGKKDISISSNFTNNISPSSGSANGSMILTAIPRYANISHSINNTSLDYILVNWLADSTCDLIQYSVNGGDWINTSGNPYIITGLKPNTSYSIKTRARRRDSGLWNETSIISGTTKDIARISSVNNFNHGSNANVVISNPSRSNNKFNNEGWKYANNSEGYSRN